MWRLFTDETYGKRNRILAGILALLLLVPTGIAAVMGGTLALYIVIAVATIALLGFAGRYILPWGPMHGYVHKAMPPEYYDDLTGRSDRNRDDRTGQ